MSALLHVALRTAEATDEKVPKPLLRARHVVFRIHRAQDVIRWDLPVECSDQTLEYGDIGMLDKPRSQAEAFNQLQMLSGKSHFLHSAVVVAENGKIVWRHVDTARLTMRKLSDSFLEDYLDREYEAIRWSVGGYRIEGPGVQLFEEIVRSADWQVDVSNLAEEEIEALEQTVERLGLVRFGAAGDAFDPMVHEALTHTHSAEVSEPTCVEVFQPGYRIGDRVVRPARVAVADPESE